MKKRTSILSVAAVLAASTLALQSPAVIAAGDTASTSGEINTSQSAETQRGVPGVDVDLGNNASDRGLPGVEMNVGRDGDQNNVDTTTLGAGADTGTASDDETALPMRADRN